MDAKDIFTLEHIADTCDELLGIVSKHPASYEELEQDLEYQYVCAFLLIQIGEAANDLSASFVHAHPEIEWRNIVDTRNQLTHNYGLSSAYYIWQTITDDIKPLCDFCRDLIK